MGRIFFPSKCSAEYFFLFISLQDFFSSKKCHVFTFTECIYIYIVVIVVIVQYGAAKPLNVVSYRKSCYTKTCFWKIILYTHLILRHNISDAPQVGLKTFSFLFKKKSKKQFTNAHSMVIVD